METLTQNAQATSAPDSGKPKAPKAPKARKAKAPKAPKAPQQAVVPWDNLPKGIIAYRKGDMFTVQKGKFAGSTRPRQQDMISLPTPAKLMEANPGMTQAEADKMVTDMGTKIKPGVMAEISRAGSNAAYIVKRYVNKMTDKTHDIGVSLHRVQVQDEIDKLAVKYNMTRDAVIAKLGLPVPKVLA